MAVDMSPEPVVLEPADEWFDVCDVDRIEPDRGVCALVAGRAVAIFRLRGSHELRAIDNVDPFSGASVLSRGLVGATEIDGEWVSYVASPLRKQRFDLATGRCLDDPTVQLDVHRVSVERGRVLVAPCG
jgi:nitrite reductase (NADH) small subunit